ncbi:chromate resistance protein [Streptomyces sp. YC537]|uniref:Chromate resistance protein n=2 Tax=Streptomyces boluensis TaxID=1775135 RepID=A0A964XLI5_9ACTN|nr:chromate resistance protein [Streptomyces boluensis]
MPREPSTPRIAVWRKLKRLGVAQLGDGLVALPADARTREQLERIAEEITDSGGTATLWFAHPALAEQERELARTLTEARAAEYRKLHARAQQAQGLGEAEGRRVLRGLRAELRRINRRDYFPPPERRAAEAAVNALHPSNPSNPSDPSNSQDDQESSA